SDVETISTTDGDITNLTEVIYNNVDTSTLGTYKVTYKAVDSSGAVGYDTIDVVVSQDIPGENATIAASDTNIKISDAPKTDAEIIELMNVLARDIDGTDITDTVTISDSDGYNYITPELGSYEIEFSVIGSNDVEILKTATLTVINDTDTEYNAELVGNSPIDVALNSPITNEEITTLIDPKVINYTDGEITGITTDNITLVSDGGFDSTVEKTYTFVYQATVENVGVVENSFLVKVSGNIDTESEVAITATNPTVIEQGSVYDPIISSDVEAISTTDGAITASVVYNNVDTSTVYDGYQVMYYAVDSVGAEAYYLIDVNVVAPDKGENATLVASDANAKLIDAPITDDELKSLMEVLATDADGTDITDLVTIQSFGGYDYNNPTIGSYEIVYSIKGTNEVIVTNTKTLNIVSDDTQILDAKLIGNTPIDVKTNDGTTTEQITTLINPQVILYTDGIPTDVVTEGISLISDGGYDNTVENEYTFVYEYTTLEGLTVQNEFLVKVLDDYETISEVTITADNPTNIVVGSLYDPIITSNATATSTTDGDITNNIEVLYNDVDTSVVGDYTVMYKAVDSSGAVAYLTITVSVVDAQIGSDAMIASSDYNTELSNAPTSEEVLK
ncbi:MAG: immunoglobulin-like domain-containing protein, partial [Anaeroplasmataceae bacterium]